MTHIQTLNGATLKQSAAHGGCGECQTSCQSACKTSCTVAHQKCENKHYVHNPARRNGREPPTLFLRMKGRLTGMVHTFICLGVPVAVDVNSGAVHVLDKTAYEVLSLLDGPMAETCPQEIHSKLPQYEPAVIDGVWTELLELQKNGLLFTGDSYIDPAAATLMQQDAPIKALCLHVSHDCTCTPDRHSYAISLRCHGRIRLPGNHQRQDRYRHPSPGNRLHNQSAC